MENEIWLPIKYGNGKKEISSLGNVRNAKTKRMLKSFISKRNGYRNISFHVSKERGSYTFKIHRLVAEHFIPNPDNKRTVNHKDLNKLNNRVDNLEWNTTLENIAHYYKNGFKGKISDDDVLFIRENIEGLGCTKIAEILGIGWNYVLAVANGTYKPNVHSHLIREKRTSLPVSVKMFDKNGECIGTYPSIGAAAKAAGTRIGRVQDVLKGIRKTAQGFNFKYTDETLNKPYTVAARKYVRTRGKVFHIMNLEGIKIAVFNTQSDTAKYLNAGIKTLQEHVNGSLKTIKGHKIELT